MFTAVKGITQPSDEGFRLLTLSRVVKGDISIEVFNGNVREGDETVSIQPGYFIFINDLAESLGCLTMRIQEIIVVMTRWLNLRDCGDFLCYNLATSVYLQF